MGGSLRCSILADISVQPSCSVVPNSLWSHGLQYARLPCPSPTTGAYSNSCQLRQWCHPTISSSVIPFSSHLQSFPASGSFPMSPFFAWGGQSIGASASVLPMNIQGWFPLGLTGWISLQSVQLLSCVRFFATSWTAAHQASLSIINYQSLLKLMSTELVMPSNHLILCRPLLLAPSIFNSIRVFSNETCFCIRWTKYWSFTFNISASNEYSD